MYYEDEILVGPEYQAVVPKGLSGYGDALPYDNEDKLLWEPGGGRLREREVEDYLRKAGSGTGDDEWALLVLLQAGHDPEEALRRLQAQHSLPPPSHALPSFSPEECTRFEQGLTLYGKDFRLIHLCNVRTRSIGELVHFYYLWKKSERFDIFPHHDKLVDCKRKKNENAKNYKRKDKIPLNPNVTDYMGTFLDEDLKQITDSTENLILNGEQIQVKQEPFIKQERIDD